MWLLKTEPSAYGYDDLEREGRTTWDGVSNPAALKNLRSMKEGDRAVIYHTGDERSAVGLAEVVRSAYADPKRYNERAIAGICSKSGQVLGLMPHPERNVRHFHHPEWTRMPRDRQWGDGFELFQNAVRHAGTLVAAT